MRLENKVAVITGAGSGMGRAMAILFAQEGAKIVAGEWNQTTLDEIVATVGAAGVAYTASKHALVGLTKSTAWIYGPKGVRCNAIAPGGVETNIVASVDMTKFDPYGSQRTGVFQGIMPGMLQAVDIANLALFLAADESRYINGTIIPADAGWLAA